MHECGAAAVQFHDVADTDEDDALQALHALQLY
jgi:hypothetical protein